MKIPSRIQVRGNSSAKEYDYKKGLAYGVQGKFEEAEKEFRRTLGIDQLYTPARQGLRLIEGALEKKKIKETAVMYFFKGVTYYNKGMFDEAIVEYKKAIAIDSGDAGVYYNLGAVYYEKKQYDLAIEYCDKAKELGYPVPLEFLKALEPHRK